MKLSDLNDNDIEVVETPKQSSGLKLSDLSDNDIEEVEAPSSLQAANLGVRQALTGEFGDELSGLLDTLAYKFGESTVDKIESTKPEVQKQLDKIQTPSFGDVYKESVATQREQLRTAQEEDPYAYYGANIAANFLPAGAIGKAGLAGSAIKDSIALGAATGAITGAGASEADDLTGIAKDTAAGTALGGILGGTLPLIPKAIQGVKNTSSTLGDIGVVSDIIDSFKTGKGGTSLIGKKASMDVSNKLVDFTKKVIPSLEEAERTAGKKIGELQTAADLKTGLIKYPKEILETARKQAKQLPELRSDEKAAKKELLSVLDELIDGKQQESSVVAKTFKPVSEKTIPGKKSSVEQLNEIIRDLEGKNKFLPDQGAAGEIGDLFQVPSQLDDVITGARGSSPVGGSSRYSIVDIPDTNKQGIFDKQAGKFVGKSIEKTDAIPEITIPGTVETEVKTLPFTTRTGAPEEILPSELNKTKRSIQGLTQVGDKTLSTNESASIATDLTKRLDKLIKENIPGLEDANREFSSIKQVVEMFKQPDRYTLSEKQQGVEVLTNMLSKLGSDAPGDNIKKIMIQDTLGFLKKVEPSLAAEIETTGTKLARDVTLAKELNKGFSGETGILKTTKSLAMGAANLAGKATSGLSSGISKATPDVLKDIVNAVSTKGSAGMKIAQDINNAMTKDEIAKNATLFALEQNPDVRKLLKDIIGE